ncbi:MAG: 50S ribosomal protein L30 [Bacteroidetes bacterium]|nr:MAG: 50S ribosomal protein L30 [Bacteroidota bacterium]
MATIKIKQVRSAIKRPADQKATIKALGFRKLNQVVEKEATPQVLGMVKKVQHLVEVVE